MNKRSACLTIVAWSVGCSSGPPVTDDAGPDVKIGNPLDGSGDTSHADVWTPPDATDDGWSDASDGATAWDGDDGSIADASGGGPVFDLDALAYCTSWSCAWTDAWTPMVTRPPDYTCVRCTDNSACTPQPWANGCDAGTVYDPVVSPYDGSSSVLDFCVPNSCPPR